MAKSLDELIDFLLDEIALDGDRGASLQDIVHYTKHFYAQPCLTAPLSSSIVLPPLITNRVDRKFIGQLWKWLTQHADLSIGRKDEFKNSSLDDVELAFPSLLEGAFDPPELVGSSSNPVSINSILLSRPAAAQKNDLGPRVIASQDRIYLAVCGHEPDPARVSELEFALLRTVGAARNDGILQGELGRATNQDKRSVPKRTNALHEKGYVVKEAAYNGGHKTSRIFLRRFAHNDTNSSAAAPTVRLLDLARQILAACKEYPFITQDDVAQLFSISSRSKRHVFDQVIKHLAHRGCLKKIKTAFAPDSATSDLMLTLQFVRQLDDTDLDTRDDDLVNLETHLGTAVGLLEEADIDSDEDVVEVEQKNDVSGDQSAPTSGRPSWNPDRSFPNVIHDLAVLNGDRGITNVSVRQQITGLTVKRPVESILARISSSTPKARSSNTHDLALLRTVEGRGALNHFVYRPLGVFGDVSNWSELTEFIASGGSEFAKHTGSELGDESLKTSERDEFGFPKRNKSARQMNNGRATLEDTANIPGPSETVIMRPGEATIVTDTAGVKSLATKPERVSNASLGLSKTSKRSSHIVILKLKSTPMLVSSQLGPILQQPEPAAKEPELLSKRPESPPKKIESKKRQNGVKLGRPRKFAQGTEEYWQTLFWIKRHGSDKEVPKTTKETGLMTDPDCLKMFADRPKDFDQTVVRALEQNLPVPRTPAGINGTWVNKTNEFLHRTGVGAFYVPSGTSNLRQGKWSCPMVVRSPRLEEVDWTDKHRPAPVMVLSSSAAHTFRHYRNVQWYIGGIRPGSHSGSNSSGLSSSSVNKVVQTTSIGKDDNTLQSEHSHSETHAAVEVASDEAAFVNDSATIDPPPPPALTSPNLPTLTSRSSKKPNVQDGRAQRQRRPTKKALESAQSFAPSELRAEDLDNDAGASGTTYAKTKTITTLPLSTSEAHSSSTDAVFTNTNGKSLATSMAGPNAEVEYPLHFSCPQKVSNEPGDFTWNENDVRRASHHVTSEPAPKGSEGTEVQTGEASSSLSHTPTMSATLPVADSSSAIDINEIPRQTSTDPIAPSDPTCKDAVEEEPEPVSASNPATSTAIDSGPLQLLVGRDAVPYYKKFLEELVYMCGGVVPHDPSLLKRAMGPKSVEAHVEPNMNIKIVKSVVSQMTQSGKLKTMQFAFQRNGFNHAKAIIALPNTQPDDQLFLAMQTKISLLPANVDYVPPELEKEANRKPQGILRHPGSPILGAKTKINRVASARPKRQNHQSEPRSRRGSSVVSRQLSPSPAPPGVSLNTGFLTLKVPGIARIRTDKTFTSNYFSIPAQPLILDPSSYPANAQTSSLESSSVQRNGVRKPGRPPTSGAARTIKWRVPKCTPLPKSLRAILAYDHRVNEIDHKLSLNPALETFDKDVDFVATWEQDHFNDVQEPKSQEWNFINHFSARKEFINVRGGGDLQFRQITFNSLHEEVETNLPEAESWDVFAKVLSKEASKLRKANDNNKKRKRKTGRDLVDGRSDEEDEEGLSDFNASGEEPQRKRQKGPNLKLRRKPRVAGTDKDRRRQKRNHANPRGIGLRDIPKALAHRITTAIVVVRVLTGGLDKYLDWKLVARLIPGEPESMLQSRWRTLSTRYNNDFDAMVEDLQTKYLDALADDRVPSVNYDDLNGTDWEGIHAWAVANINAEDKNAAVMEIPPNRDEFLELNTAEVAEPISVRHLHNMSLQYTQATKEDFWCSVVFGTDPDSLRVAAPRHIEASFPAENDEANVLLARARSWVFAAVLTPHQSFNAHTAHEKLRRLAEDKQECEKLIESTLKKLQNNKMVVTKDSSDAVVVSDGSTLSGTYDWKLSTKFLDRFEINRYITSRMLKQAVQYKIYCLDPNFARGEPVVIPGDPLLEDGVMVAIFNLMNSGMLQLEPGIDMPETRYGIDGESEGYQTRCMDKKNLYFSTNLRPTPKYVLGDLALSERCQVAVPRGDMDRQDGLGLIPVWFDINHNLLPDIWDMVVGAVTGMISCRPGVSTIQLMRGFDHVLSGKDLQMITQYLSDCGMIQKTCTGWETTETWWFAVGIGTGLGVQNGV